MPRRGKKAVCSGGVDIVSLRFSVFWQDGATLLHHAAHNGVPEVVEYLCHLGANVNLVDKVLLENCAPISIQSCLIIPTANLSQEGHTPLFKAVFQGDLQDDDLRDELCLALLVAAGSRCTYREHKGEAAKPGDTHHERHIKEHPQFPKGVWEKVKLQMIEDNRKAIDSAIYEKKQFIKTKAAEEAAAAKSPKK